LFNDGSQLVLKNAMLFYFLWEKRAGPGQGRSVRLLRVMRPQAITYGEASGDHMWCGLR